MKNVRQENVAGGEWADWMDVGDGYKTIDTYTMNLKYISYLFKSS